MISEETLQRLEARLNNPRYANSQGQVTPVSVTPSDLEALIACARKVQQQGECDDA